MKKRLCVEKKQEKETAPPGSSGRICLLKGVDRKPGVRHQNSGCAAGKVIVK